ncbi:hypothetical protein [Leptolyngbya iicbica]|uniref:Uncharacterized protein n=2 Tax=Cyanophyceae TaxID=3028117 RepID=A0A4Q7EHQ7_9CYAN|nr:hypothetical protein [Leptolyngbya sp. LK]RZM82883.1 hypothetical protein DYY88_06710 [Leptolyngbya sp. LK]
MRYLAKIERASFLGNTVLQPLARQVDEYLWETIPDHAVIETKVAASVGPGAIVLATVEQQDDQLQIVAIDDVVPWLLELLEQFLSQGITPDFLAQEAERAEQWRQSLTLESQEVERRALETAARRDEIQELERNLKVARAELEQREAELLARQQEAE